MFVKVLTINVHLNLNSAMCVFTVLVYIRGARHSRQWLSQPV